jgi:hypothetical protein
MSDEDGYNLTNVPYELWSHEILPYLSAKDIVRVGLCCRHIHRASTDNALWKHLMEQDWFDMTLIHPRFDDNDVDSITPHLNQQENEQTIIDIREEDNEEEDIDDENIELLDVISNDEMSYQEMYRHRALKFYNWKRSLYSTRVKLSDNEDSHSIRDWLLEFPHLFLSYIRILIWMFIYPRVQPSYVPIQETEKIKQRALDAGSYLVTSLMFLPLSISGMIVYADPAPYPIIMTVIHAWFMFSWMILIKYGSITSKVNIFSEPGVMQMRVSRMTMCAAFLAGVLLDDLILNNVIIVILSIALAISRSLEPMISYRNEDDLMHNATANANLTLSFQERLFHGNSLISATLNGVIFAVIMGIGGIKFTIAVVIIAVFVVVGASPVGILQFLGLLSPSRALVSMASGAFSFLLYYFTKWSLLSGGFPNRYRLQRIGCWIILCILTVAHIVLLYRITDIIVLGSPRYSISSDDEFDDSIGTNSTAPSNDFF